MLINNLIFIRVAKSCGDPGNIENGRRIGENFIIASSVNYTCDEGYEMVGQARRFCQSDNQWSGQAPKCERESLRRSITSIDLNNKVLIINSYSFSSYNRLLMIVILILFIIYEKYMHASIYSCHL